MGKETKEEVKEVEEQVEPLICKTCVLKVSIHCEGCKRKVKKVLRSIDGVYNVDIDLRKQKVVVKGIVDSKTLIKKLTKIGRHAELWPEKAGSKKKKQAKSENKEKQSDQEADEDSNQTGDDEAGNGGCATGKSGSGKKKKKKKGQKGNNNGNKGNQTQVQAPPPNQRPPCDHIYQQYPPHYYAPPGCTCHTSPGSYLYAHVHPGFETEMEPSLYLSDSCASKSSCTFELLSDENPNGCAVM